MGTSAADCAGRKVSRSRHSRSLIHTLLHLVGQRIWGIFQLAFGNLLRFFGIRSGSFSKLGSATLHSHLIFFRQKTPLGRTAAHWMERLRICMEPSRS